MSEVRRFTSCCLTTPCGAPGAGAVSVIENVVATTWHVVNYSICVNAHTVWSASFNQTSKSLTVSMSTTQVVRYWLIVKPPGIQFTVLWPFVRENWFLCGEHFNAHPPHLSKCFALSLNVFVRPAEHFDDTSLLTVLVCCILVNSGILPDEVWSFRSDCELSSTSVNCLYNQG